MLDTGGLVQVGAFTIQHERDEVYAASMHRLVEAWKECQDSGLLGDAPPAPAPSASSLIATCLCLLASHLCGVQRLCHAHGQTCVGLSSPQTLTNVEGNGHTKPWASGRQIRAATTRYGSTWILWGSATVNHITKDTIDEFS